MQNESGQQLATRRLDWRVSILAFFITVMLGSSCTVWALQQLHTKTEQQARHAAQALAHSVAQTISQQIARAIRIGIPPRQIPGLDAYLQRALDQAPGLAYISLRTPDQTTLHTTLIRPANEELHAEVQVHGQLVGLVAVGTAPARLTHSLTAVQALSAVLVLCIGLLCAWLALRGPGQRLQRQHQQLVAALQGTQHLSVTDMPHASDALQQALEVLAHGQQQQQEQQSMLNSYVQELLAVDFDHRMQLQISQIMQSASTLNQAPASDGGH